MSDSTYVANLLPDRLTFPPPDLKINRKKPLLWIGEQRVPVVKDRGSDLVMDSVINYYFKIEKPKLAYRAGKLFLDNGAFSANMNGIVLDVERVISVQESLRPNLAIPLDYPFRPKMSIHQMRNNWENTMNNISYWQNCTSLSGRLVPALHAWDKKSLINNISWLNRNADADYLAIGSLVSSDFSDCVSFFGDRQPRKELIDMIAIAVECIKMHSDFKVHLMGFGSSPLMLHLGYYLGVASTDSSGYRRKAAYGKIILPGTGERYVGNTSAKFGMSKFGENDLAVLRKCDCPVCRVNQDKLWSDWKARAIHNEHVIKQEAVRARTLLNIGLEAYERYLDNIFGNSSLNYLWQYTKLRKKFYRISKVLFRR